MDTASLKWVLVYIFFSSFSFFIVHAMNGDYPTANLSTTWTVNILSATDFQDGSILIPIIINNLNFLTIIPAMGCGFFANGTRDSFYLVVFAIRTTNRSTFTKDDKPTVLWEANRGKPVKQNATLQLSSTGDLVLRDVNGSYVWSTNTPGESVVGMKIAETGNLFLFNSYNESVWQSFDHPTDTWLPVQKLVLGGKLVSKILPSSSYGPYYLSVQEDGLYAFIESSPPQMYFKVFEGNSTSKLFKTGRLNLFDNPISANFSSDTDQYFQFMKLESDGHLRVYQIVDGTMGYVDDILTGKLGDCAYPAVCGSYGICSDGHCSCPIGADRNSSYFKPLDSKKPSLGCEEITELSCGSPQTNLLELDHVSYFEFVLDLENIDIKRCKHACLTNCSCKAALFQYHDDVSFGNCSLPSEIFSLMSNREDIVGYNSTTFVKVQKNLSTDSGNRKAIILGSILGVLFTVFLIAGTCVVSYRKRKGIKQAKEDDAESFLDNDFGTPRKFSFHDLELATNNFDSQKRLGGGGFGTVYEGILEDGTKVAIKRLDRSGQEIKKEFEAEVKTIGRVHHINLVTLVGYCAEKPHQLLVYEYMPNGSLDKWIFNKIQGSTTLNWQTRSKIILGIAKGLSYLHEDCLKKIFHLDIKPQNVLLDSGFNAKISDFGLARLIDREKSHATTKFRGTPGYIAPEFWQNQRITEKADVYSFGVVVMEMMCGRKNGDPSLSEDIHCLLHLVKSKADDNNLLDLVDKHSDMELNSEKAVHMMRIAIKCLQRVASRPSMSMVVKALEGDMEMEVMSSVPSDAVTFVPSDAVLSGPR